METLESIAAAIELIDTKKEILKKACHELQAYSSLLSPSLALSWSDLDAHFTSLQNSLIHKFRLLGSLASTQPAPQDPSSLSNPPAPTNTLTQSLANAQVALASVSLQSNQCLDPVATRTDLPLSSAPSRPELQDPYCSSELPSQNGLKSTVTPPELPSTTAGQDRDDSVMARPDLRAMCEKMDGKGLRKYIKEHSKEREAIRVELLDAMRSAPDPGAMVLDAMDGFYDENSRPRGDKDPDLCGTRRDCVLLLEKLMGIHPNLGVDVRERAKRLALEWKGKVNLNDDNPLQALGFLHLVAAYGLGSEFDKNELVDYLVAVARYRQGTLLCRAVGLRDKIPDLIQKLLDNGKQLLAIKFIFEFQLIGRFPPVPLLKAYLKESKKAARQVCSEGKNCLRSQNEAIAKQLSALKAVSKVIEEQKLESEYPLQSLEKRIEQLEKQKADRKRSATAPAVKSQQQQPKQQPKKQQQQPKKKLNMQQQQSKQKSKTQQQSGSKRPRTTAPIRPAAAPMSAAGASSTLSQFRQTLLRPAGLLSDHSAAYLGSAGPYGVGASAPIVAPYASSSAGLFGLAGVSVGFHGNQSLAGSRLYSSESQMGSSFYDRATAHGGYGLPPQYNPAYYP